MTSTIVGQEADRIGDHIAAGDVRSRFILVLAREFDHHRRHDMAGIG
jgi:hypothetical protein